MAGSSSGTIVAGITAVGLATVAFFAYQANATAPAHPLKARTGSTAADGSGKTAGSDGGARKKAEKKQAHPVPANSGSGLRIVYALNAQRVWLVAKDETPLRTFKVARSSVSPAPGQYAVTSRATRIPGSDGVAVEHVVRFAAVDGVVIGFSAAVDGSMPDPYAERKTGGIRSERPDGKALWDFAPVGTKIMVVA
ncbi:hypothetical protein AB0C51_06860 [Streptomyces pathocidini]|uniref:hypothetical protein n=1 Tax=Streptomyces pathocidini TaxID=1650571 RepID=UPI0033C4773E